MSLRKRRPATILDPTRLCRQCVIGCTVLPSLEDPNLNNGVALTTLEAYDAKYVKFEDIDGQGQATYRYWKDVYLIVAWNDPNYKPLTVGDKVFALYQNPDKTFTTVYYNAKIRSLPKRNNQIIIDFLDGTAEFLNIKMVTSTQFPTKDSAILTVPTVIRRLCASNTKPHQAAMLRFERTKKNKISLKKASSARSHPSSNTNHKQIQKKHVETHRNTHRESKYKTAKPSNRCASSSAAPSVSLTPLKKPRKSSKKQVKCESDSDSSMVIVPTKHKSNIVNNINIGVDVKSINKRKRKHDEMNNNHPNTHMQPPLKRQRSSRRKAQKLKVPSNTNPTQMISLQKTLSTASTASNVSSISNASTPSILSQINKAIKECETPTASPVPIPQKTKQKKRTITIKRKKKTVSSVLPSPPPMPIPSRIDDIKQSHLYKSLMGQKFPEKVVMEAMKRFRDDSKNAYNYCQKEMVNRHISIKKENVIPPQQQLNVRTKFKKMWGSYDVEMPLLPHGFTLFDSDLYLDNFSANLKQMIIQSAQNTQHITKDEWFVSGLGIKQKWTEPQEIGDITVGPYVVDMDIMD